MFIFLIVFRFKSWLSRPWPTLLLLPTNLLHTFRFVLRNSKSVIYSAYLNCKACQWYNIYIFKKVSGFFVASLHFITKTLQDQQMIHHWWFHWKTFFSNFSCRFLNPNIFPNLNYNCSNILDLRNLQEQVKKAFCFKNWSVLSLFH